MGPATSVPRFASSLAVGIYSIGPGTGILEKPSPLNTHFHVGPVAQRHVADGFPAGLDMFRVRSRRNGFPWLQRQPLVEATRHVAEDGILPPYGR